MGTIKIILKEELTEQLKNTIVELQRDHKEKVKGIYELYDHLYINGNCESYNHSRIYYVAYTLANKNIDLIIK